MSADEKSTAATFREPILRAAGEPPIEDRKAYLIKQIEEELATPRIATHQRYLLRQALEFLKS